MKPAALVLAGSRPGPPDPVAAPEGVWHKALVEIEGQTMLARVVDALRTAEIDRIAVLASDPKVMDHARELGCEVLLAAAGPSASVAIGLEKLGAPLLVTTSDHALLRPEWVRDFITDTPAETDVAVLLARREAIETAMPDSKRTYLRFADGQWSGCNLFLLASEQAGKAIDTWKMVEADRKHAGELCDWPLGAGRGHCGAGAQDRCEREPGCRTRRPRCRRCRQAEGPGRRPGHHRGAGTGTGAGYMYFISTRIDLTLLPTGTPTLL